MSYNLSSKSSKSFPSPFHSYMIQSPFVTLWKRSAKRVKLRLSRGFSQFFKTTQSAVIEKPGAVNPEINTYPWPDQVLPRHSRSLEFKYSRTYVIHVNVWYYLYLCYDSDFLSENVWGCPHDRNQLFAFWKGSEHHLPKPSHLSFQAEPLDNPEICQGIPSIS